MPNITLDQLEQRKKKLEISKLEIEYEKLLLEKAELKKSWYKKPQWWSVLVPLMIGAGTVWIAFSTGVIGIQKLTNQKESLEKETNRLKNLIKSQNIKLRDTYIRQIRLMGNEIMNIEQSRKYGFLTDVLVDEFKKEKQELQERIDSLEKQQPELMNLNR